VTRTIRPLALVVMLAFAAAGCVQQGKPPAAKRIKRVAAANKSQPSADTTGTPSTPSGGDAKKPTQPDATERTTPSPTRPGAQPGRQPPTPPPRPERPTTKDIEAEDVGLPIYPGAETVYARQYSWGKQNRVDRLATLSSGDAPDKIIKWYRDKLGDKARVQPRDLKTGGKRTTISLYDPRTQVSKLVSVAWTAQEPGVATTVRIGLTVRSLGKKPEN
jgi:hypothetical protein